MSVGEGPEASGAPLLRRDARRNRERLVEAAHAVFAEQGLEAPLDVIARRAGVGNATLYRHFPTRAALVDAVFWKAMVLPSRSDSRSSPLSRRTKNTPW